jgi:hypothetical protein
MPSILSQVSSRLRAAAIVLTFGAAAVIGAMPPQPALAQMALVPAQAPDSFLGPEQARGAVIWSHGRSMDTEDSTAPTPDYIAALKETGWDTFRLNRLRDVDTLEVSGAALAQQAEALKRLRYQSVVLAGQSFGAFISLIAAGQSDAIDAVIATAPAAYGSIDSNPAGYGLNASKLYHLLQTVRHARVALFFFAHDIFDPGGRGVAADRILAARGLPHLVIDRPDSFRTHWAANTPLFAQRFGECLAAFAVGGESSGAGCRAPDSVLRLAGLPAH